MSTLIETRNVVDTNELQSALERIFSAYPADESSLIMILQDVQEELNWLPPEALDAVADHLHLSRAKVQGVATFYRAFSLIPREKR